MSTSVAPELRPLIVSVRQARAMLGGISHNKFWSLVSAGEFEVVGAPRKRYIVVRSLEDYIA